MGSLFSSIGDALKSGWNAVKPYVPIAIGAAASQAVANQQQAQYPATSYPATQAAPAQSWSSSPWVLVAAVVAGVALLLSLLKR